MLPTPVLPAAFESRAEPRALKPAAPVGPLVQYGLAGLALLLLLRWAAPLLVPITIALVLTVVFSAPVEWLARRRVPVAVGALGVIGVILVGAGGATLLLADQGFRHWGGAASAGDRLVSLLDGMAGGQGALAAAARWARDHVPSDLQSGNAALAEAIVRAFWHDGVDAAVTASAALLLLFFMLISQRQTVDDVFAALGTLRARRRLRVALCECQRGVGRYLWVMTVVNVGLAAVTGVALRALGIPQALLWAVATFMLAFVPYLGPLAITGLLLLAGAARFGASPALLAPPLIFLGLHGIEANLINPWLMGFQLHISRVAVLIAVMVGAWCWGLAGGLLAVPILIGVDAALRHASGLRVLKTLLSPGSRPPRSPRSVR